ncbi:putative Acid phosphatase [Helianthus anomalus]
MARMTIFAVHITQGDHVGKAVIVSWVTMEEQGSDIVIYWRKDDTTKNIATGIVTTYTFYDYASGFIHHCNITDLEYDTRYYYEIGIGNASRTFWFTTPPEVGPDVPYTFGLIGTLSNLTRTKNDPFQPFLFSMCYISCHL